MSGRRGILPSVVALLGMLLAAAAAAAPQQQPGDTYQEALQALSEGRKNDALKQFQRAIDEEPMHAGAMLEIALIQCSLGNSIEAERLFATVETRFNPPPGIMTLIDAERRAGCEPPPPQSSTSLTFARGIDQNVNQGAKNPTYIVERDGGQVELPLLADFMPKHDQYSLFGAEYTRELTENGSIGFAQFQNRRNDTLREFDSASLYVGAETPARFGRWTMRSTGMVGLISLGGKLYQRQAQLQTRIGPPLPLPGAVQFTLMGGVTHTQHVTLTNFDSNTFELRGQFSYRKDDLYSNASLGYITDHATTVRPGGDRSGPAFNLMVRRPLWGAASGELAYSFQGWNSELAYAPGLIDEVRRQATHVVRGTLVYPLARDHALQLEARIIRNDKDISIFRYDNRQLQLSYRWQSR